MKREIEIFEHAGEVVKALKTGVLLTTKAENKVNSMTIGWGTLGVIWGKPTFIAFVRENRFTTSQLEKNPEFTVNIPQGAFNKNIVGACGTKSGRDMDKIKELGLTLETPEVISVPGIKELPLTLECRVMYQQKQDAQAIGDEIKKAFYPQDIDSCAPRANRDFHVAYYAEIVRAYIIE